MKPIDYAPADAEWPRSLKFLWVGLIIALCGTLAAAGITVAELWYVPPGTPIRPMDLALHVFLIAFITLVLVTTFVLLGISKGQQDLRSIILAIIAFSLSFAPLPASGRALNWVVTTHGLVLED